MKASLVMRAPGLWVSALSLATGALAASNSSSNSTLLTPFLSDDYLDLGVAADAYAKAKAFVAPLNTTEKILIAMASSFENGSGNQSWTAYTNTDGVSGLNFYYYVSAFPMGGALTQTWSRDLYAQQYAAIGEEYFACGYDVIDGALLGPLGRVPEGGRQNEAFSPDPYLSGVSAATGVKAQQAKGIITGVRHFLLYEQETNRMSGGGGGGSSTGGGNSTTGGPPSKRQSSNSTTSSSSSTGVYSSEADDKTLHEVYMWPWGDAINAGAMAVMCAMPRVNGTYSCENNQLLSGKLKEELGFPGFVYPDESAQHTAYDAANAGLDYSPYSDGEWTVATLTAGISNGSITDERLTDMAVRAVLPYYFVGLDKLDLPKETDVTAWRDVRGNHSTLIRQVGGESLSLLKNNNTNGGGLPLNKPKSISLYGAHAGPAMAGPNYGWSVAGTSADIFQGHLSMGQGSGELSLPYLRTPYDVLTERAVKDNSMIWWIMNNTYSSSSTGNSFGISSGTGSVPSFANYAANAEVCLAFINSWSGEGADRSELSDDDQDAMVNTVADNCNNTIVVVNVSGPRVLDGFIEHENITAVVYGGLLGQESGNAIADVLYGDVNPSGKLIHTIAKNASDYPASVCEDTTCPFSEGVNVDYRYFDANSIEPRYAFGHGLSYTTFPYGNITATVTNSSNLDNTYPTGQLTLGGQADLFDTVITVSTTIQNSGDVSGKEVAQLYISFPEEAAQPVRVLRGFEKVEVTPGQSTPVSFQLRRRDVSYWDVSAQKWKVARGTYTFAVGSSSRDIRGNATLTL